MVPTLATDGEQRPAKPAGHDRNLPSRRPNTRRKSPAVRRAVLLVVLAIFLVASIPSAALAEHRPEYRWSRPALVGNLTFQDGQGGIVWGPNEGSEDDVQPIAPCTPASGQTTCSTENSTHFTSAPFAQPTFFNASRRILIDLYSSKAWKSELLAVELFVGGKRLSGTIDAPGTTTVESDEWKPGIGPAPPGWYLDRFVLHPEADRVPAGGIVSIKVQYRNDWRANTGSELPKWGFDGLHQSRIVIEHYAQEEAAARVVDYPQGGGRPDANPSGSQDTSFAVASWLALLGYVGRMARRDVGRNRRPVLLAVLLLLATSLAGCATDKSGEASTSGGSVVRATEIPLTSDAGSGSVGHLGGIVLDELGRPLPGVVVSALGTDVFTKTDARGKFRLQNLSAGTSLIRYEHKLFQAFEDLQLVEVGKEVQLEVSLEPRPGVPRPHRHSEWSAGEERRLVFDRTDASGSGSLQPAFFDFGIDGGPLRILPGTYLVEFNATVKPSGGSTVYGYRACVKPPTRDIETCAHPRTGLNSTFFLINWEMADRGHQKKAQWTIHMSSSCGSKISCPSNAVLRVRIVLHRGVVPLEEAHRDFWGEGESFVTSKFQPISAGVVTPPERHVPPFTKWLEMNLEQAWDSQQEWTIAYQSAGYRPWLVAYPQERDEVVAHYRLALEPPDEGDSFYEPASLWRFKLVPERGNDAEDAAHRLADCVTAGRPPVEGTGDKSGTSGLEPWVPSAQVTIPLIGGGWLVGPCTTDTNSFQSLSEGPQSFRLTVVSHRSAPPEAEGSN